MSTKAQTTWSKRAQKAHRAKWVEALRSGRYRQGAGYLNRDGAMCCLGVACDLSGVGEWKPADKISVFVVGGERDGRSLPPTVVLRFMGLHDQFGSFGTEHVESLADMNDSGKSFAEIADIIESEPPGLVVK